MVQWQSALTIGLVGVGIYWFLSKGGCQGDGTITGEGTPLCYTGESIADILANLTGGGGPSEAEVEEESEKQQADTPDDETDNPEQDPRGSPADRARMQASQLKRVGKTGIGPTGVSTGITPAKRAGWAHAYLVQNSITVA